MKYLDQLVDSILLCILIYLAAIPCYYFSALPEEIPIHFNAQGQVDQYGAKNLIWIISAVGAVLIVGLRLVRDQKKNYNYPIKITEKNEEVQYQLARRLLQFIAVLSGVMFCALIYDIIAMALGYKEPGLPWILPAFVILLVIGLIFYMNKVYKAANK